MMCSELIVIVLLFSTVVLIFIIIVVIIVVVLTKFVDITQSCHATRIALSNHALFASSHLVCFISLFDSF